MGQSVASAAPRRGFKEFVRKFFVSLKRSPQNIAMVMMLVTYVFYSLNLTSISDTTAYVGKPNMGQCQFVAMLLGILSFVSFLRAFPRREKPKIVMIILTALMLAASTFAEIVYANRIESWLNDPINAPAIYDNKGNITEIGNAVYGAQPIVSVHIILLLICIALIVALPVYSKLIKKINTSIDVAGNENMNSLDMASDDE